MNFSEALDAMKDGKKVRACNWADEDYVYAKGVIAYNYAGEQLTFDFLDTQSEWELYEDSVQPNTWIKFSKQKPKFLPFWFYADGNVSIKMCHDDDYLSYVEDKESAAWMHIEYPLPPRDEKQYRKWEGKNPQ